MNQAAYRKLGLFIDNALVDATGRGDLRVVNPATEEVLSDLPVASTDDLDRALQSAARGFAVWRNVSALDRSRVLRRAADLLRERVERIAAIQTLEQGKTLAESRIEVRSAADIFDWYAEEGRRAYGRLVPARDAGTQFMVRREPVGPVAAFAPWNFPAVIPARKIAAALAAGCSCIIKPAEETPGTCLELAQALADAGLPPGVLNVVTGVPHAISSHLIASPVVRKVTFTGSTFVGKEIGKLAAEGVKRTTLELGGHAPVLVFEDADLDRAVQLSVGFKYRNAGQVCISPTRFYVHSALYERFVDRFATQAQEIRVGAGFDPDARMGPLANGRRVAAMEKLVSDAVATGARLVAGGKRIGNRGFFWEPTVLADVPNEARVMNEEPFGPVAAIRSFASFEEAEAEANRLPYGLAAYAFTESARTVSRLSDRIETGMLGINNFQINLPETPFGGVKESGYGSEGGAEGLDAYLATKLVSLA